MNFSLFNHLPNSLFSDAVLSFPATVFEKELRTAANYCRDTEFTSLLHPGRRCYREITPHMMPGKQFCFGPNGIVEESHDLVSPVGGKDANGFVVLDLERSIAHFFRDVLKV